jgi:type IV pilus assembly protein PilO
MTLTLTKLPWYAQVGAFLALGIGACGAFYYYYEQPARVALAAQRSQLAKLKADIAKGNNTARQLEEFQGQVASLEARLDNLKAILPEEKDAADLLRRMQTVATQSNLVIKSFKPEKVVVQKLNAEWPIALELEGTYHNLAIFFDRIGKFTRIVNISGVDVKALPAAKTDQAATIDATCVATTFVLLDNLQAAGKAGAKPGAKPATPAPKKAA